MNKPKRKTCLVCSEVLRGRSDKIFCSSDCRTAHHNALNKDTTNFMANINNILRRNRRILMQFNKDGKAKIPAQRLAEEGFKFAYHTNQYVTKTGKKYTFCYDQGYLEIENGLLALVVKHDYIL